MSSRDTSYLSNNRKSRDDTEVSVRWKRPDVTGRKLRSFEGFASVWTCQILSYTLNLFRTTSRHHKPEFYTSNTCHLLWHFTCIWRKNLSRSHIYLCVLSLWLNKMTLCCLTSKGFLIWSPIIESNVTKRTYGGLSRPLRHLFYPKYKLLCSFFQPLTKNKQTKKSNAPKQQPKCSPWKWKWLCSAVGMTHTNFGLVNFFQILGRIRERIRAWSDQMVVGLGLRRQSPGPDHPSSRFEFQGNFA